MWQALASLHIAVTASITHTITHTHTKHDNTPSLSMPFCSGSLTADSKLFSRFFSTRQSVLQSPLVLPVGTINNAIVLCQLMCCDGVRETPVYIHSGACYIVPSCNSFYLLLPCQREREYCSTGKVSDGKC